jgi:hypothetical protein
LVVSGPDVTVAMRLLGHIVRVCRCHSDYNAQACMHCGPAEVFIGHRWVLKP